MELEGHHCPHWFTSCVANVLAHSSADSVDHFIENGQPIDAIRLARTFGLTGKYTPLAIMNDYIENAKKDAEDILSKESYTPESRVCSVSCISFFSFETSWIWKTKIQRAFLKQVFFPTNLKAVQLRN